MFVEVCANTIESAIAAERGGADRIELCDNIAEGGTTPSYGMISFVKKHLSLDIHVLIRPRGSDFIYCSEEIEIIKNDIAECIKLGVDGVVFGMLTPEGKIDKYICQQLVKLAYPMKTTFHRAFDLTDNPLQCLDDVISCGFDYLLTSGIKPKAIEGKELLKQLVTKSKGKIHIMPGGGINDENILEIANFTGAKNFHISVRRKIESKMKMRNESINIGNSGISDYERMITDENVVRKIKKILNNL